MDEFVDAMEGFLQGAKETYKNWPNKKKPSTNWAECFQLLKTNWKIEDYLEVEDSDDIIVRWAKEGVKKDIRLTFYDQLMWNEFLEKQEIK